jgi:hypothetical protein
MLLGLQHSIGNQAVTGLLTQRSMGPAGLIQREGPGNNDELKEGANNNQQAGEQQQAEQQGEEGKDDLPLAATSGGQQLLQQLNEVREDDKDEGGEAEGEQTEGQADEGAKEVPEIDTRPRQISSNLDQIYAHAQKEQNAFNGTVSSIAATLGGETSFPPGLKGRDRAQEKIATDYGGDASLLCDVLRASIAFKSPNKLKLALDSVKQQLPIVRLKDRFAEVSESGYRDMLLNVETPGGHIAELQLHLQAMLDAKKTGGGHKFYEDVRSIVADAAKEKRPLTAEEVATIKALNAQSRQLYDNALAEAMAQAQESEQGEAEKEEAA